MSRCNNDMKQFVLDLKAVWDSIDFSKYPEVGDESLKALDSDTKPHTTNTLELSPHQFRNTHLSNHSYGVEMYGATGPSQHKKNPTHENNYRCTPMLSNQNITEYE